MADNIYLEVNGKKVERLISYSVESGLYVADHAFSLELANPANDIQPGMPCKLYVNNQLELTGLIDRRFRRCDKSGRKMTIEGRDLMGLLVDSYCEEFITVEGATLSELAERLIFGHPEEIYKIPSSGYTQTVEAVHGVPFINRKQIVYQQNLVGKLKTRRHRDADVGFMAMFDTTQRLSQISPGMTVFQVLSMYALSRGQMFYGLPDGTFVFGRPLVGGDPKYEIILNPEGVGNNVISAEVDENFSRRYSKVTVIGQQQMDSADGQDTTRTQTSGSVSDPSFPFYKPFVATNNNDSQSPSLHARLLLEKMRHDGFRLCYTMPRHSQNCHNYTLNTLAYVRDTVHGIDGTFLVSGRTYRLDKDNGATTTLTLSPPGLVEDGRKIGPGRH